MAKIFLVLSIIASIAAGILGYFTLQQIKVVKTAANNTKKKLVATNVTLSKTKDQLSDATSQLATTKSALDAKTAEAQTLQGKVDEVTKNLTDAQAQVTDLTTQLKTANDKLATYAPSDGNTVDPNKQKIDELTAQLAESQQLTTTLKKKADEAEAHANELAQKIAKHDENVKKPGLEGVVMAVNPGWNFAVISIGDQKGAVANAELLVKRGDTLIGKLKITTVEPATSIADIVPDSVAKGQRVLPGDRVIFTGQSIQ